MNIWPKRNLKFLQQLHKCICSIYIHKACIQEWFDYIRNVKTLWLISKTNVANFGLIYNYYLVWQETINFWSKLHVPTSRTQKEHSAMNYTITLEKLKFAAKQNFTII